MTTYLGLALAVLVGVFLIVAPLIKNILHWKSQRREFALEAVKLFVGDLANAETSARAELCARMLSYLRSDVEYCLARDFSIRTLVLSGVFFLRYTACRARIFLRLPPREIDALCTTVHRLSESARWTSVATPRT